MRNVNENDVLFVVILTNMWIMYNLQNLKKRRSIGIENDITQAKQASSFQIVQNS